MKQLAPRPAHLDMIRIEERLGVRRHRHLLNLQPVDVIAGMNEGDIQRFEGSARALQPIEPLLGGVRNDRIEQEQHQQQE